VESLCEEELRKYTRTLLEKISIQEQRIAELTRMVFGRSSEKSRYMDPATLLPFAELADLLEEQKESEATAETVTVPEHKRKANKRRKDFPPHLPVHTTVHSVDPEDLPCPDCGEARTKFGEEIARELERIEFTYLNEITREKCVCRKCEGNIVVASGGQRVIEKGLLGPGFLSQIISERFGNHMPYARLEKKYKDEGLSISRSVMCSSVMRCAELLQPVYDAHIEDVLESLETSVLQSDDTTVVQRNGNEPGRKDVFVWAWRDQHSGVVTSHAQ